MSVHAFDLSAFEIATGAARAELAAQVDAICRETGFLAITGHGVPENVIEAQWAAVDAFFAQDMPAKRALTPERGQPYGYLAPLSEALAASRGETTPPDLKESFNGGPLAAPAGEDDPEALSFCYAATPFPDLPGFEDAWRTYYAQMEALAARIMRLFAAALGLPDNQFDAAINAPISALRALHYPATQQGAEAGQQRAGAHSDYGSLTILLPQAGSTGLQIEHAGSWVDVTAPSGAFVINIGDLMARWTSDRWVSTVHRVIARPNEPARKSLAYFHQPNWHANITPLDGSDRYPAVRSGPYLMNKFRATSA